MEGNVKNSCRIDIITFRKLRYLIKECNYEIVLYSVLKNIQIEWGKRTSSRYNRLILAQIELEEDSQAYSSNTINLYI
jgi:hypothetical protein